MSERCPKCGTTLPTPTPAVCPQCQQAIASAPETGITATPASAPPTGITDTPAPERPVGADPEQLDGDATPAIVRPEAVGPPCPAWLLVTMSAILCGAQGAMTSMSRTGKFELRSDEAYLGAAVGMAIGIFLAIDYWFFRKKLDKPALTDAPVPAAAGQAPSDWIPVVMLLLPIASTLISLFGSSMQLPELLLSYGGSGAIIATAILGYFSIRQMALYANRSRKFQGALGNPAFMYLGMLALWIVCYPVHFLTRARMGGRNLLVLGLIATGVYCLPIFLPSLTEPELPSVDNPEVLNIIKQFAEQQPGLRPVTIKSVDEMSFDQALQKRVGRCRLKSKFDDEEIVYTITWQDRSKGLWIVNAPPILPQVDSPEVLDVLKDILIRGARKPPPGPVSIRDATQVFFDVAGPKRIARAIVVAGKVEEPIRYTVEWENDAKARFLVKVLPQ